MRDTWKIELGRIPQSSRTIAPSRLSIQLARANRDFFGSATSTFHENGAVRWDELWTLIKSAFQRKRRTGMPGVLNATWQPTMRLQWSRAARDIFKVSHLYKLISTPPSSPPPPPAPYSFRTNNKRQPGKGYRAVIFTREITWVLSSQKIGKVKRSKNAIEVKNISLSYSNTCYIYINKVPYWTNSLFFVWQKCIRILERDAYFPKWYQ